MRSVRRELVANARKPVLCRSILAASVSLAVTGCIAVRHVEIKTTPSDALVRIDGELSVQGKQRLSWLGGKTHTIEVLADGYASKTTGLAYEQATSAPNPWQINIDLKQIRLSKTFSIETWPRSARVAAAGQAHPVGTDSVAIVFRRAADADNWSTVEVCAALEDYQTECQTVSPETARPIYLRLAELRRNVQLEVHSNTDGADVLIDGEYVGTTPLEKPITIRYERSGGDAPWNRPELVVKREYYRWQRAEGPLYAGETAPFHAQLDLPLGSALKIVADLEPIRFYRTVARHWDFSEGVPALRASTVLSRRRGSDPSVEPATEFHRFKSAEFALTRLRLMPGTGSVLYSYAFFDKSRDRLVTELRWATGDTETRLFGDGSIALDPTVDPKGIFVYFCAGRAGSGGFEVYRVSTLGKPGVTRIVKGDPGVRYAEPAIKQNGEELAYIAYHAGSEEGQIHIAPTDGGLQTFIGLGRQPSWSPDNKRLAFVHKNQDGFDQIWVFDQTKSEETQITPDSEQYHHRHPVWTRDFNRIVFAADAYVNDEGERHFDIFLMKGDGTVVRRLTSNGSFDSYPSPDPNGDYIYFLSNRWAGRENDNSWAIWRINLPND